MDYLEPIIHAAAVAGGAALLVEFVGILLRRRAFSRMMKRDRAEAQQREQAQHWSGEIDGQQT